MPPGGMPFLIRELLAAGLLHEDVQTVAGRGLSAYSQEPLLGDKGLAWQDAPAESRDDNVLRTAGAPFSADGGLRLLTGNLGRSVIKVSAVAPEHQVVEAPAMVFTDQAQVTAAYKAGKLTRDVVVVVREQGPRANGMPELHKLTPALSVLQSQGHRVALVTDGRMSGASGTVPAAIHVSPESLCGGPLARVRDGDVIRPRRPRRHAGTAGRCGRVCCARPRSCDQPTRDGRQRQGTVRELPLPCH